MTRRLLTVGAVGAAALGLATGWPARPSGGSPPPAPFELPPDPLPTRLVTDGGCGRVFPGPRASDRLPDVLLTTHRGDRVRFVTDLVRDRVVILNFMYTRCDGSCPGTSALLEALRPGLTEALGRECVFLSLTLDPAHDTPAALAEYAADFGAAEPDPKLADWLFLTGQPADLDRVRRAVGLADPDPRADADRSQHASLVVFGDDRANRWSALPVGYGRAAVLKAILRAAGAGHSAPRP